MLASLVSGEGDQSKHFLRYARAYNCALQLASTGVDSSREEDGFIKHLRIQGKIYHCIGPLHPDVGCPPQFAQLYIHDTEHEIDNRGRVMTNRIDKGILGQLQNEMHEHNAYVRSFRAIASHMDCEVRNIILRASNKGQDARRYNLPTASKVAAIIPGDGTEQVDRRNIVVYVNGGGVRHISDANEAYIPLHFVLLFPYGEAGWHPGIPKHMLSNIQENEVGDGVEEVGDRVQGAVQSIIDNDEIERVVMSVHQDEGDHEEL
jgi:hypothetical protein